MIQITPQMRILVAIEPTDFRRGIDGLARQCREVLRSDPFSGALFVFRSRSGKGIKILCYDGQGYWLCQKRLSKGRFRFWPTDSDATKRFRVHELQVLLNAGNPAETEAPALWRPLHS
jgi:transposase